MSIFDRYDTEYRSLLEQINSKISQLSTYDNNDKDKSSTIQLTSGLFRQADDLLKQLDMEARDQSDR